MTEQLLLPFAQMYDAAGMRSEGLDPSGFARI